MNLKSKLLILGCVGVLAFLGVVGSRVRKYRVQIKTQSTRQLLMIYAAASTNYASAYGLWPQSVDALFNNTSNLIFVIPTISKVDSWGRPIEYEPFNEGVGFGFVRSLGADGKRDSSDNEVRFGKGGIMELHKGVTH